MGASLMASLRIQVVKPNSRRGNVLPLNRSIVREAWHRGPPV